MSSQTLSMHRIIKAKPEKVYKAFTNPIAYASWIAPNGFLCVVHEIESKVGGRFRMSFENFSTGRSHSFGGSILEMRPNEFISYSEQFEDPGLPGVMTTSISMREVMAGTELTIKQENIPAEIPIEMCYLGWQESLEKLSKLVEPEIPDA